MDINLGRGSFAEVAVFHKRSRTLLVTDSILSVPVDPPEILQLDPYPLVFHAKNNALEMLEDNEDNHRKGWQRISLFALYLRPSALEVTPIAQMFRDALKAPQRSLKTYFGLFPFRWQETWKQAFDALRGQGRPFVAPILQILILPQAPSQVFNWADTVASWDFQQIIPCHFDSQILANPCQFRQAFAFLEKNPSGTKNNAAHSDQKQVVALSQRENLTIRQLAQRIGSYGELAFVGTSQTIADDMEQWLTEEGSDGFNVMFPFLPEGLDDFVDRVVPELQQRGIFRQDYQGKTLRENLGLARPANYFFETTTASFS